MQELIEKIKNQKPKVTVFDNFGETQDRYTIVVHNKIGDIYGCNEEPFYGIGQNVGETTQYIYGRLTPAQFVKMARKEKHLGKVVKLETLPEEVLKFINQIQSYG